MKALAGTAAFLNNSIRFCLISLLTCAAALTSPAAYYYGANYDQSSDQTGLGPISGGKLQLTDNGTTLSGKITLGSGSFSDNFVMMIDRTPGGFSDTTAFGDYSGPQQRSISGFNGGFSHSYAYFPSTFGADYAITMSPANGGRVYSLVAGGNGSLGDGTSISFGYANGTYNFSVSYNAIGGPTSGFTFIVTDVSDYGARYLETYEPYAANSTLGSNGRVYYTGFDTYGVVPVPETANSALLIFGALAGITGVVRWKLRRSSSAF
jgi:hypothetical protein